MIETATFPIYAQLQGEPQRLRRAYFRIASVSVALSTLVSMAIITLVGEFVRVFLGDPWLAMIAVVRVLAGAALLKSIASTGGPLFKGSGRPQYGFRMQLGRGATVAVLVVPMALRWGIVGAAVGVMLSAASMLAVWFLRTSGQLRPRLWEWFGAFGPPPASARAMVGTVWLSGPLSRQLISGALGVPVI